MWHVFGISFRNRCPVSGTCYGMSKPTFSDVIVADAFAVAVWGYFGAMSAMSKALEYNALGQMGLPRGYIDYRAKKAKANKL